jgi:hypothetical protein
MISEKAFAHSFESFWQELLPLLTPAFMALFNEAYQVPLFDKAARRLSMLPVAKEIERPDVVAEFAFRLARISQEKRLTFSEIQSEKALQLVAETNALSLIQRYSGLQPDKMHPLTEIERADALRLCDRYMALYRAFSENTPIQFCPRIPGAGFINTCEGDISIGDCLVEVKTITRSPGGKDLRQLITYAALGANAGTWPWSRICIFNPRRGALHLAEADSLILRLSGGKPKSDVYADLIAFAESNDPAIERKF